MANRNARSSKRAGMTLITALAFTVVVGTVLAGVGNVALSHYSRATVERSYATAVSVAEAGINYELRWISKTPKDTSSAHGSGNPYVGSMTDVPGTFSVYVTNWDTANNTCGTGTWTNPLDDLCITSTGTVAGDISRTVRVRARHQSVFGDFAIYAIDEGTFGGGGSGSGTTTIVGDYGTNGDTTFNGTKGTGLVDGTVYYNGTTGPAGTNTQTNPNPVNFPTVSEFANSLYPGGGLTWLQTHNNNANIMKLKSTDTAWSSEPTVAGITAADVATGLTSAGFTVSSRTFGDPTNSVPADTSNADSSTSPSSTWRFVYPGSVYGTAPYGIQGLRTYFVPPGDYYFNNIDFKAGNAAIVFLTHLGPIRIWVDNPLSGAVKQDSLNTVAIFTDLSPSKFRIYYNKCSDMNIAGSSTFPGGFYAVNPACGPTEPEMKFTGGTTVYGSIITNYFTLGGSTQVIFPNTAGPQLDDAALWFGFKDNWKEVSGNGNPVFADGTSN